MLSNCAIPFNLIFDVGVSRHQDTKRSKGLLEMDLIAQTTPQPSFPPSCLGALVVK